MIYEITFARSARKELEALPPRIATRVFLRIESLAAEPRPQGCMKLQGPIPLWRIRIGAYRVIYEIDDEKNIVDISLIRHRSDAYK